MDQVLFTIKNKETCPQCKQPWGPTGHERCLPEIMAGLLEPGTGYAKHLDDGVEIYEPGPDDLTA